MFVGRAVKSVAITGKHIGCRTPEYEQEYCSFDDLVKGQVVHLGPIPNARPNYWPASERAGHIQLLLSSQTRARCQHPDRRDSAPPN